MPVEPGPSYHLVAKIYVCQLFGVIAKYLQILIESTLYKMTTQKRDLNVNPLKKYHILLCSWEGVVKIIYPNFKNNIEFFVCFVFRQVQFEQKD